MTECLFQPLFPAKIPLFEGLVGDRICPKTGKMTIKALFCLDPAIARILVK
jgi:hypothetical protein